MSTRRLVVALAASLAACGAGDDPEGVAQHCLDQAHGEVGELLMPAEALRHQCQGGARAPS